VIRLASQNFCTQEINTQVLVVGGENCD
jgi:hypothetical protein